MCATLENAIPMLGQQCMARNNPVTICITKHVPSRDPKFHHALMFVDVGRSISALLAIFISGCDEIPFCILFVCFVSFL
jgi:hypothetical protein